MSNSYLFRMPAGIPGDVTRREVAKVEAQMMDATTPVTVFGVPVKMVSGKIKPLAGAGDVIYGFLVRPYPTSGSVNEALAVGTPQVNMPCDLLRSGYMTVKVTAGVAAKDAHVLFNATTGLVEAGASGGTSIANAYFMGEADADGNVEISFNL
jgi:hypothetical protein